MMKLYANKLRENLNDVVLMTLFVYNYLVLEKCRIEILYHPTSRKSDKSIDFRWNFRNIKNNNKGGGTFFLDGFPDQATL